MPRSRGSEMPQRQSPRGGPFQLRTSSSDSDPIHHRPVTDRTPKLGGDRRSPRASQSDPINQKKFSTRISDLESQLGQAQVELKILKEQLAEAEAEKKVAQQQLVKKTEKPIVPVEKHSGESNKKEEEEITAGENQRETDVFEVPVEMVSVEEPVNKPAHQQELKPEPVRMPTESSPVKPSIDELAHQIDLFKAKVEEKEKELELFDQENENLKSQLKKADLEISSARAMEEELTLRLNQLGHELETSKSNAVQLNEKLEVVERVKEELETEMKKLRVQTEQWRKAADAAAAVLSAGGGVEMNGRRISDRCGSMDKHYDSVFEPPAVVGSYAGFVGMPGFGDDSDDGFGNGKRKGSGIRMFGDLWKKKGHSK